MTEEQLEKLKTRLIKLAKQKCLSDDPEALVVEASGGNVDDAYNLGYDDGKRLLARSILTKYFGIIAI